jgi:hypothetical protein
MSRVQVVLSLATALVCAACATTPRPIEVRRRPPPPPAPAAPPPELVLQLPEPDPALVGAARIGGWYDQLPCDRISLELTGADLPTVVELLAGYRGVRAVVPPGFEGRVDVRLHDIGPDEALERFLATLGEVHLVPEDGGRQLRLVPVARTLRGRVLALDERALSLTTEPRGERVEVAIPAGLAPAVRADLAVTREGDRVAARCDARRWDHPVLVALVGG